MGQEQGWSQVVGQPLGQQGVLVVLAARFRHDRTVDFKIALAPASRYNHVHAAAEVLIVLHAGIVQRKARSIGADLLPRLHLAHVAS